MAINGEIPSYAGRGCGCCAHCRCTGACGWENRKVEIDQLTPPAAPPIPPTQASIPSQYNDKESVINVPAYNKSLWSTLESLPHPNDLIMSRNSSRKDVLMSPEPLTPFLAQSQQKSLAMKASSSTIGKFTASNPLNNDQSSPPLLPSRSEREKREEEKPNKLQMNASDPVDVLPGQKPSKRLPSRKNLLNGGLSIEVPKTKVQDEEELFQLNEKENVDHKNIKAKSRNVSRRSMKKVECEDSDEEDEDEGEEESDDYKEKRSRSKKRKDHIVSQKRSKSMTRKRSQHWKDDQKLTKTSIESDDDTVKTPPKPKVCRKCSMNTLAKLKLLEEHSGEAKSQDWNQTPQLGTFTSPRFDRTAFTDPGKVQEEIFSQQLQRQRDREWEREQERERENFAREIAQREQIEQLQRKRSSSKTHSPSVNRTNSKQSFTSARKMNLSSENEGATEEEPIRDSKVNFEKTHKKHHIKKSHGKKHETISEDETSDELKTSKSHRSKTSRSKKHPEVTPTSEENEEIHQKPGDTSPEEEDDVIEMKNSKKTNKKPQQHVKPESDENLEAGEVKTINRSPSKDTLSVDHNQSNKFDQKILGPNVAEPQELKHTISIGNFSITRTRTVKPLKEFGSSPALRSLAKSDQEKEDDVELKRDKLKKILDTKMKEAKTLKPKNSFAILSSGPRSTVGNKSQNDAALTIPRLRSTPSLSTLNAIKKLIVQHAPASVPNTLYFIDMARMDEQGNPLIAFRLHADPMADSIDAKMNKKGHDWLMQSHETGTKLKGRLWLSAGKDGQLLFVIDIKQRRVDKFIIQGAPSHLKKFTDSPHWGTHEDYRHLYCQSPEKRQLKWFVQEPGKLMRLFGRSEDDHGYVYAEARLSNVSPTKKNRRTTKETALCFYDPTRESEKSLDSPFQMDIGYLCATWFCARQTYDEGQFAAAHAEVEMIENIEKTFEVDLLAGA